MAPTALEAWAAHRRAPHLTVLRCGAGLRRRPKAGPLVICGLAGGLAPDLPTGFLMIPDAIGLPDGRRLACDRRLVDRLRTGAARVGLPFHDGPIVSLPWLVTGEERERWRGAGYLAADMESGPILTEGMPAACLRVVLDTPARELSSLWLRPWTAVTRPSLWPQLLWLSARAPALALRAAAVTAAAFPAMQAASWSQETRAG